MNGRKPSKPSKDEIIIDIDSSDYLEKLPNEMIDYILSFLSAMQAKGMLISSKRLHGITKRHYSPGYKKVNGFETWHSKLIKNFIKDVEKFKSKHTVTYLNHPRDAQGRMPESYSTSAILFIGIIILLYLGLSNKNPVPHKTMPPVTMDGDIILAQNSDEMTPNNLSGSISQKEFLFGYGSIIFAMIMYLFKVQMQADTNSHLATVITSEHHDFYSELCAKYQPLLNGFEVLPSHVQTIGDLITVLDNLACKLQVEGRELENQIDKTLRAYHRFLNDDEIRALDKKMLGPKPSEVISFWVRNHAPIQDDIDSPLDEIVSSATKKKA